MALTRRCARVSGAVLALALAGVAAARGAAPEPAALAGIGGAPRRSPLALESVALDRNALEPPTIAPIFGGRRGDSRVRVTPVALSAERAQLLLQSLTLPGWGQMTLHRPKAAAAFGVLETGIWASFAAFRIQQQMRRQTYERTALLFAGIDLRGRDEEFRRVIGFFESSDDYNRLVVRRDAANLYFGDPAAYEAYVAANEITGADAWRWDSFDSAERYRRQRQETVRAGVRANTALALAVANRLLSVIHVTRLAGKQTASKTSWRLECVPVPGDATAFHFGMRARF